MREQWALYELSGGDGRPAFPWLEVVVLAPCGVLAALGIRVNPDLATFCRWHPALAAWL